MIVIFIDVRVVAGSVMDIMAANRADESGVTPKQVEGQPGRRMKPDK